MESGTCGVFKTHLSPTRARCPHFRFVPDGSALQSVENGKAKVHLLPGALAGVRPTMSAPLTRLVGHVHPERRHVLEVRREYGCCGTELVGFESFPNYDIFASAFDDQGTRGAVLARCTRTNAAVVIVFPEPDPMM
jgi:hypothetical protein